MNRLCRSFRIDPLFPGRLTSNGLACYFSYMFSPLQVRHPEVFVQNYYNMRRTSGRKLHVEESKVEKGSETAFLKLTKANIIFRDVMGG